MVSKASEDFPEPLTPVTTVIWFMGIENEMFLRLLTRAPRTSMAFSVMVNLCRRSQTGIQALSQTSYDSANEEAKRSRKRLDEYSSESGSDRVSSKVKSPD